MESDVKLNPAGVRKLRESKSWTQEHLASAADVSLRTIQRMEAVGSASAESALAVAAALGVPVESIHLGLRIGDPARAAELRRITIGTRWGYTGLLVGALASAAGIVGGSTDAELAGTALGILGAFTGVAAAAIGMLSNRAARLVRSSPLQGPDAV